MRSSSDRSTRSLWRHLRRLLPISFAVAVSLTFGTVDAWAKANVASPPVTAPASPESLAETRARIEEALPFPVASGLVSDELVEYAQREAQSSALETFQGGSYIVIGGSTLALVLVIVLLIILL